jgi:D-beta-D-heptose 7-phosphate kinase/D-beta-D-heptose 1-phosphate adenosyltransferase|tara:strand:+ start:683 stop:1084 length:402 start_codon:yes stop_codon:yes gene_type:complete
MKKVFVNGTFDVLHRGHLKLLNYAKSLGDFLYVAIDTDDRVKEKKGSSRPVNTLNERLFMLENLKSVDCALYFSSDESLEALVKSIKPDIMVVGSDWKGKSVIGSYYSAELKFFDRIDEYSSTQIIQSIIDRR